MVRVQHQQGGDWVTLPAWLWVSVGSVLLLFTGGVGTWAGSTLMSHDRMLENHSGRIERVEVDVRDLKAEVGSKMDKILDRLEAMAK